MRTVIAYVLLFLASVSAARADYVKVSDDLTIHYQTAGDGPQVILLVPGWTMSSDVFEKQLQHFKASKDFKLVVMDPRSQGLSTHTLEGNFYEQHGRDLEAFIMRLQFKNIILGGWSNGGFDILSYVHQFGTGNLKGLIMIDAAPTGSGDDNQKEWVWFRKDDSDGYRRYFTEGPLLDREKVNDEFAHFMVKSATPAYLDWMNRITNQTSNGVAALLNESSAYQDYSKDLETLEGKAALLYVVHAEWKDVVGQWAQRHTPSAKVETVEKHLSFWENADQFNGYLDAFLALLR